MEKTGYSVYRLFGRGDLLPFRGQPLSCFRKKGKPVTKDIYHMICMGEAEGSASIHDVDDLYSEAYPGKHIEVSDVVMLNRDGVMFCYFRDEKGFCLIEGFIQNSDSDAAISYTTRDYMIKDTEGLWYTAESLNVKGKNFYLMENQEYGERVCMMILDEQGRVVIDNVSDGFRDKEVEYLKEYVKGTDASGSERYVSETDNKTHNKVNSTQKMRVSVLKRLSEKKQEVKVKYKTEENKNVIKE
jgi:hypothetical protein